MTTLSHTTASFLVLLLIYEKNKYLNVKLKCTHQVPDLQYLLRMVVKSFMSWSRSYWQIYIY
jgi:hypothetical protein